MLSEMGPFICALVEIVAYADLGASNVDEILAKLTRNSKVVGIRHVLNHHADDPALVWPRVAHDRYLKDGNIYLNVVGWPVVNDVFFF